MSRILPASVVLGMLPAMLLAGACLWLPVDVPAAASRLGANTELGLAEGVEWTQEVRVTGESLSRVAVILADPARGPDRPVVLSVRMDPAGPVVRRAEVRTARLYQGAVWDIAAGRRDERWTEFSFEPLPVAPGMTVYISLTAPGTPPEQAVRALANFGPRRGRAELTQNGRQISDLEGNLLYRTYERGTVGGLLAVSWHNLTRGKPGFLGVGGVYLGLGALAAVTTGLFLRALTGLGAGHGSASLP
jgi:hypothetical protein